MTIQITEDGAMRQIATPLPMPYKLLSSGKTTVRLDFSKGAQKPTRLCIKEGTLVLTQPIPHKIEEVEIGDYIFTHKGRNRKVTEKFILDYSGDLVEITPFIFNIPIEVTPDHPLRH